jgi:hypothetical protein
VRTPSRRILALLSVAVLVAVAACSSSSATPVASPTKAQPTDAPAATDTPIPTIAASDLVSASPSLSASASPSAGASASAEAITRCTANDSIRALLLEAKGLVHFDVYCGVLGKGWYMASASYELPNGGKVNLLYKNGKGAEFHVDEGVMCPDCAIAGSTVGPAKFGDLAATEYDSGSSFIVLHETAGGRWYYAESNGGMTAAQMALATASFIKI